MSAHMFKPLPDSLYRSGRLLGRAAATILLCAAVSVQAQDLNVADTPTPEMLGTDEPGGQLQEPYAGSSDFPTHGITVVPRLSVMQTFTDNVNQASSGKQSEQVTEISPGIHIASGKGRLRGYFDYALRAVGYGQSSRSDSYLNALDTVGKFEAVDRILYVDFTGAIAQQAITAFGTQSGAGAYSTTNRTEVSNYRLSPYLQGRLGDLANYVVRMDRLVTQSDSASAPGTFASQNSITIDGTRAERTIGWLMDVSRSGVDYSGGRYTESDLSDVGLSYAFTPQLSVFAKAGVEANNYTTVDKQSHATNEVGLKWNPSERTQLLASQGHRSFGESHAVSMEHSTNLVVLKLSDVRDVSTTPAPFVSAVSGFVLSALSLQRRQDLTLTLRGVRDTLAFAVTQTESTRVDTLSTAPDDLARGTVHQSGARISYLHRLTPVFNLGFIASLQQAWGAPSLPDSWLREFSMNLTGKVTRKSAVAVGLRHASYTGATPYEENAVTFNLTVEF
ncbi:MAG: TIGR03016 family PEP-CTERM system-associated outer membrane protein [Rhodoferax sp.]|nr:TIGR03016 family PEP-CTERM system-associated outer membrane protein [Rhodoferax sp.]